MCLEIFLFRRDCAEKNYLDFWLFVYHFIPSTYRKHKKYMSFNINLPCSKIYFIVYLFIKSRTFKKLLFLSRSLFFHALAKLCLVYTTNEICKRNNKRIFKFWWCRFKLSQGIVFHIRTWPLPPSVFFLLRRRGSSVVKGKDRRFISFECLLLYYIFARMVRPSFLRDLPPIFCKGNNLEESIECCLLNRSCWKMQISLIESLISNTIYILRI